MLKNTLNVRSRSSCNSVAVNMVLNSYFSSISAHFDFKIARWCFNFLQLNMRWFKFSISPHPCLHNWSFLSRFLWMVHRKGPRPNARLCVKHFVYLETISEDNLRSSHREWIDFSTRTSLIVCQYVSSSMNIAFLISRFLCCGSHANISPPPP